MKLTSNLRSSFLLAQGAELAIALVFFLSAGGSAHAETTPTELLAAFAKVSAIPAFNAEWSQYEKQQYEKKTGKRASFRRIEFQPGNPSDPIAIVRFYDRFAKSCLGEIVIHLQKIPPPDRVGMQSNHFEALVNGVKFTERNRGAGPHREIFLGGVPSHEDLEDRLRLSINDNEVLNPWHRRKVSELLQEWKESKDPIATGPQKEMVDFLWDLHQRKELQRGALVQMPTGMGKTEVAQFFLHKLDNGKVPYRLVWMVHGNDLLGQTKDRFDSYFEKKNQSALTWNSKTVDSRSQRTAIANGAYDHLFLSMDSMQEDAEQRNILSRWISQPGRPPVVLVMDEGHQIGAETYLDLYEWLWNKFPNRIQARIGTTATPVHRTEGAVIRYFGNRSKWAFVNDSEIDPVTGLPTISFLEQMVRAAKKGYAPIPLLYALGKDPLTEMEKEGKYSPAELRAIDGVLQSFRPMKAILFHAPGTSEEFGATSRMKQFTKALTATHSDIPHFSISGKDDVETRKKVLRDFGATTEGVLNLTGVGSTGLDLQGTNTVGIFPVPLNPVVTTQRYGRGSRLIPGGPFTRWIDWTGEATEQLFGDIASLVPERDSGGRREKLRHLLQDTGSDAAEISRQVYEVLGIDPSLVQASPKTMSRILDRISREAKILRWEVRDAAQQVSSEKLPMNELGEGAQTYLRRPDVVSVIIRRLGKPFDTLAREMTPMKVAKAVASDVTGLTRDQLYTAWNTLASRDRKEAGESKSKGLTFEIAPPQEQQSEHKLPPRGSKEALQTYLKRPDVIAILNLRLGRSAEGDFSEITPGEAGEALAVDLRGVNSKQVVAAWDGSKVRVRRQNERLTKKEVEFSVRPGPEQSSSHVLPAKEGGEGLQEYLRRPEVYATILGRLGLPSDTDIEKTSRVDVAKVISADLGLEEDKILGAWNNLRYAARQESGTAGTRGVVFEVRPPQEQSSPHKLPAKKESNSLQSYFMRADVQEIICRRLQTKDLAGVGPALISKATSSDLLGASDGQIRSAFHGVARREKEHSGEEKRSATLDFEVKPSSEQLSPHKLPARNGLGLRPYLGDAAVIQQLNLRAGKPADASVLELSATEMLAALGSDISGVAEHQLRDSWAGMKLRQRRSQGTSHRRGSNFSVQPEDEQTDIHKLPPAEGAALRTYLARPDVQQVILRRLGRSELTPLEQIDPADVRKAVHADLDIDDPKKIAAAWSAHKTGVRSMPLKSKLVDPSVSVDSVIWPQSQRLQEEMPRLLHLHELVARNLLKRMEENPRLEVFFLGRDSDDFLAVALRLAQVEDPRVVPRLQRFLASNLLLGVSATNPSQFAKLPLEEINRLLATQGLDAGSLAHRDVLIFDVGFDGHVVRPLLGTLLVHSGLRPAEFYDRIKAEFLASKPEIPVNVPRYSSQDAIEWKQLRETELHRQVAHNWLDLEKQWDADAAHVLHDTFRAYGSLTVEEFPLGQTLAEEVSSGRISRAAALALWETPHHPLMSNAPAFRDWIESFVEGKGLHVVRSEQDHGEHEKLREDLGRAHGRVAGFAVDATGIATFNYEVAHDREARISPSAEARRQDILCSQMLQRFNKKAPLLPVTP